ncbi:serine/threonine protein kinase [Candidatus Woesebacteria bacterium]|nr:serine/threonine protein kinase [Candidatus Woesebacteria bacterium]
MIIKLEHEWNIGSQLDEGGFGKVYEASSSLGDGDQYVVKLVPKTEGASREQLFVEIEGGENIIPIIDSGETKDDWALVMPKAEKSLRAFMEEQTSSSTEELLPILIDIARALTSIDGKVVHRDLKPENILLLENVWCLADFGISRYAEASTAPDTQKYAWSAPYAGPERWRGEHADIKSDVYSFGVVAYELISANTPFRGPSREDYRVQHLHKKHESLTNAPAPLVDLIDECLYKPTATRPQPANILARLEKIQTSAISIEIPELQEANSKEVSRRSEEAAKKSELQTQMERREELFQNANDQLVKISNQLADAIIDNAPAATVSNRVQSSWLLDLGKAKMQFSPITRELFPDWGGREPQFDVVATAELSVTSQPNRFGHEGRSHSLWFCDYESTGDYAWYEVAFMISPFIQRSSSIKPFALEPGKEPGGAVSSAMSEMQVAVPFKKVGSESLPHFIQWWAEYLARSSVNGCVNPTQMPERATGGPWR